MPHIRHRGGFTTDMRGTVGCLELLLLGAKHFAFMDCMRHQANFLMMLHRKFMLCLTCLFDHMKLIYRNRVVPRPSLTESIVLHMQLPRRHGMMFCVKLNSKLCM